MKLTKSTLRQIIKEELTDIMSEMDGDTGVQATIDRVESIISNYDYDSLEYSNLSTVLELLRAGKIAKAYKKSLDMGNKAVIKAVEPLYVATPLSKFEQ
jgi:hypothetical protein